jgi:large subunit ribosomal protein L24
MKFHVKKNDRVVVLSGNYRGVNGTILSVLSKKERVVVKLDRPPGNQAKKWGVVTKAIRKTQDRPQGGFVELDPSFHVSNVKLAEKKGKRKTEKKS